MLKNRFALILILIIVSAKLNAQIKVSEFIQDSKIATKDDNKLYFIDFWATWCGPCIHAKKYLGVLQKQFPSDFYIVSLSEENPLTVERFLEKKPTDLAVAIDYHSDTFDKYGVKVLPKGILFNAKGKVLWQGSSPELKPDIVSKFLRQETVKTSLDSFFEIISANDEVEEEYVPALSLEINSLTSPVEELQVVDNNEKYLKLTGSLKSIIGYLAKIYKNQIELQDGLDTNYEVYFKKPINTNENIAYKLITELGLKIEHKTNEGEVINLKIENPRFWDTNQIDWGGENTKFLISDSEIKADNVSLKDMAYKLAYVLDMPVIIPNNAELSLSIHDWDVHYKFFKLMQTSLQDNYGIIAEKKTTSYPVYFILKKAP